MSRRLRGTVQEPVEDYHDTARTGHKFGRPVEILAKDDGAAEKSNSFLFTDTTHQEAPAMNHSTATPARPANLPPRFQPVLDPLHSREVSHFEADVRATEHLAATAAVDADGRRGVRYFLQLDVTDATATEVRDALAAALDWWAAQESHLDGAEVAR